MMIKIHISLQYILGDQDFFLSKGFSHGHNMAQPKKIQKIR